MTHEAWRELPSVADQVLSRRQGRKLDLTADAWQWQLDRGYWRPVLPGVVTLHSGERTRAQLHWASVLKVGSDAALGGDNVLQDLGFPFKDLRTVDVATQRRDLKPHRTDDGIVVRPRLVVGLDALRDPGSPLPRMTVVASALFAAEWAPTSRSAEWRLATAVQRGLVAPSDVRALLRARDDVGRAALIATVLDDVELGAHALGELDFLKLCRDFDIPEPDELQVAVRVESGMRYLDFRYRRPKVRGEIDGAQHRWVDVWEADLLRGNDLALAQRGSDEIQLRWSGSQVRHDRAIVARQLRQALGLS